MGLAAEGADEELSHTQGGAGLRQADSRRGKRRRSSDGSCSLIQDVTIPPSHLRLPEISGQSEKPGRGP